MQMQTLPAGLTNTNGEIFVNENGYPELLQNRSVTGYDFFSADLFSALEANMLKNKQRYQHIQKMVPGGNRVAEVAQYTHCMHGGFDCKPDIINGVLQDPEYWMCQQRSTCQYHGKICIGLKGINGKQLTRRETQYIELTAKGYLDKEIAVIMQIADTTVPKISKKVRVKCGLQRKSDITSFALTNNVI